MYVHRDILVSVARFVGQTHACAIAQHEPLSIAYTHVIDSIPWTFSQIKKWPPYYINDHSLCSTKAIRA